jgi:CIC family chloride channel protein
MTGSILIGLLAAVLALGPQLVQKFVGPSVLPWLQSPSMLLGVAFVAVLLQRFVLNRKDGAATYDGFSDLMIHIHSPATPDSPLRWTVHGIVSFLFALCGGVVGPEGAATEISHAAAMSVRARSARWFEQRRRSDASMTVSAAVAAAFRAPFAAILIPLELGIGGRTLSAVLSGLAAFLATQFISRELGLDHFDVSGALEGFHFSGWASWTSPIVIGIGIGILSVGLIRLIRYSEESLEDLFQLKTWMRLLLAGVILALIASIYRVAHQPSWTMLEEVFWSKHGQAEVGLILLSSVISLVMVVAGFGTLGILWPLFAIGGILGFAFNQWVWNAMPGFSVVTGFAGAAAIWGAAIGAPISASVLVFEITQNQQLLMPCLIAGLLAKETRYFFKTPPLYQLELEARGLKLIDGRSAAVLETLSVREAMVCDHEMVHEHEPVAELHARLLKSPYAFLPVVNSQGVYLGLLTADTIQEAWEAQHPEKIVSKLVGAKDLLYRSGLKVPCIRASDRLTASAGLFQNFPCVPVVADDGRVAGLLFVHSVRLAYDREVARRSLSFGT